MQLSLNDFNDYSISTQSGETRVLIEKNENEKIENLFL